VIVDAAHAERLDHDTVVCQLCPAECRLTPGKHGICRSRYNDAGRLVTDNYGELASLAIDPIEKKPLYHFYPGSRILSIGPNCCNLGCLHCQNWNISQKVAPTAYTSPEKLLSLAVIDPALGVAFTYAEPIVWFEYIRDVAPLLRAAGQKVVLVTNGYINPAPLEQLLPLVDAMNIDLKGIRPEFYALICKGKLDPVKETIRRVAASPVHLELTNLIIPGENDSEPELEQLVAFVAALSDRIPLHFSAYHPAYRMDHPATPESTIIRARQIGRQALKYVYTGNILSDEGADTACPGCGNPLVLRRGYRTTIAGLIGSRCARCGEESGIRCQ
jgi:pyruvate formate lyase activating enzyme